jgi:metal-sulfur cluster biosynthetic enzyme
MLSEDDIRDALRACYDTQNPYGRPVNVVDLGLIESIALTPDLDAPGAGIVGVLQKHRLLLTLISSSTDEDAQTQLVAQIANRLAGVEELSGTVIRFATDPVWTASRISPQGRALLNLDAAHFPIINNR